MNRATGLAFAWVIVGCRDATEPLAVTRDTNPVLPTIVSGGTAVVIPTLGGQRSTATAINASGQVVGSSEAFLNGPQRAFLWQSGAATPPLDLGTLGGSSSFASALNAAGQVVGTSYLAGNSVTHGFVWKDGAMTDLDGVFPTGINATGQIVGWFYSTHFPPRRRAIFLPTGQLTGATDLGTLGGTDGVGSAINGAGQIVGWSFTTQNVEIHATLWQSGQSPRSLGKLGGAISQATAINAAGQVAGWSSTGLSDHYHAVVWQPGATAPQDLGTLGGTKSQATAINDAGQVVGWSMTAGDAARHMFLWTSTDGMEDLGLLGWHDVGGVNDNLQIVGGSTPGPAQIFHINFHPKNYAPVVTTLYLPEAPVATGTSVAVSAAFTDANATDIHTGTIDWGDGTISAGSVTEVGDGVGSIEGAHTYQAAGRYAVSVTVTDQRMLSGIRSSTEGTPTYVDTYVSNVAPVVTGLSLPDAPAALGTSVRVNASFTDANSADSHTAIIDWGDGATSSGIVSAAGSATGSVSGVHSYSGAGVYIVSVRVIDAELLTDIRSSSNDANSMYLVIYDASAGYVAGHGSITSPAGAYAENPTATGKASFGFVSKYARGAAIPSGSTQFQFTAGQLQFESTSYAWLVIAGARAQYKGSGTINNAGDYRFLLTAVDGKLNGGSPDAFRLKIWDATTGTVIYDNERGASEDAGPTSILASGSIKIHK